MKNVFKYCTRWFYTSSVYVVVYARTCVVRTLLLCIVFCFILQWLSTNADKQTKLKPSKLLSATVVSNGFNQSTTWLLRVLCKNICSDICFGRVCFRLHIPCVKTDNQMCDIYSDAQIFRHTHFLFWVNNDPLLCPRYNVICTNSSDV